MNVVFARIRDLAHQKPSEPVPRVRGDHRLELDNVHHAVPLWTEEGGSEFGGPESHANSDDLG